MTIIFEKFTTENIAPPSQLEKLSSELREQNLDIQSLDSPIVLDLTGRLELEEASESQNPLDGHGQVARDAADGTDRESDPDRTIICRNESLEGDIHPVTGIPFERKIIEVDGDKVEGVFPQFESVCKVELPKELHQASNKEQFDYANKNLSDAVKVDPDLEGKFTEEQLEQIGNGDRPDGYVWHHAEDPGELQLVDRETHDSTGHTGGQVLWGGGSGNR